MSNPRIIVALDYPTPVEALTLANALDPRQCRLKVGKELFCRGGPAFVERLVNLGFGVFLDLKFHDIPNTVARSCAAAAELGVWMINVHALGGRRMLEAARAVIKPSSPLLIAVTVLTSLNEEDMREIGLMGTVEQNVLRLAVLARQTGMDGVVCSAHEAAALRQAQGGGFYLVTPGIRPRDSGQDDQRRTLTPFEAMRDGADYLVIGRPITAASTPVQALLAIQSQIDAALPPR